MIFGLLVILVGAVFLLQNLGYLTVDVWEIVWPVAVILLGISIITKSFGRNCCTIKGEKEDKKE